MSPKEYLQAQRLRQVEKELKRNSFELYTRILARLLLDHKQHEFLRPLSDALRRRDWPEVYRAGDSLSTQKYLDATGHFVANQFSLLVKKYPWVSQDVSLDPEKAAVDSFFASERRCSRINRKFQLLLDDPSRDKFRKEGKLAMAWIRSVIGSKPSYRSINLSCDFGQGASIGVHGQATHLLRKLSREQKWTVSAGAIHHAFGGLLNNYHYLEGILDKNDYGVVCLDYARAFDKYIARLEVVNNNKLSFVLKTAKTHRSIATEPLLNGFYQKGIDVVMRKKLLRIGLDLSDQSLNQRMAREGSSDDSDDGFVTIDLRAASNSNAIGPVRYLYPPDWFVLFDRTRSHYLEWKGDLIRYNMLCSMGNGFCFPVETLTFAAICYASGCGHPGTDFSVYGDDIIIRKRHAAKTIQLLKHYGFTVNSEKTFLEGPFRESCGADWFNGEDVRPFTLDFALDKVENVFKFLNLSRRNERTERFFRPVRHLLSDALPPDFRFFRPYQGEVDSGIDSLGDEHLTCPNCVFDKKNAKWSWKELHHEPIIDFGRLQAQEHELLFMGIALRGAASVPSGPMRGLPSVTFRRRTRTKVVRKDYASTSNWLPPDNLR